MYHVTKFCILSNKQPNVSIKLMFRQCRLTSAGGQNEVNMTLSKNQPKQNKLFFRSLNSWSESESYLKILFIKLKRKRHEAYYSINMLLETKLYAMAEHGSCKQNTYILTTGATNLSSIFLSNWERDPEAPLVWGKLSQKRGRRILEQTWNLQKISLLPCNQEKDWILFFFFSSRSE